METEVATEFSTAGQVGTLGIKPGKSGLGKKEFSMVGKLGQKQAKTPNFDIAKVKRQVA